MRRAIIALTAVALLSGCGIFRSGDVRPTQVGLPYPAKLAAVDGDRTAFFVTTPVQGVALAGARESLRYAATTYCFRKFGSTDVDWVRDPGTGDWATAQTEGAGLQVRGRCLGLRG